MCIRDRGSHQRTGRPAPVTGRGERKHRLEGSVAMCCHVIAISRAASPTRERTPGEAPPPAAGRDAHVPQRPAG
eukprot:6235063-Prymnesium_polylepis.1